MPPISALLAARQADPDAPSAKCSPFTCVDGHNLAIYDWPLSPGQPLRAVVLLVHGLGEHAWRYNMLATELNAAGFAVRGYDQRGHGESTGKPGCIPRQDSLLDDLAEVVEATRTELCRATNAPLVLLGHSMGGLVASLFVARQLGPAPLNLPPVDALVLSSPALQVTLAWWQRILLALLPPVAPHLKLPNGLDASKLSHDPAVVKAYLNDRRTHNILSPRLAQFIAKSEREVLARAPQWRVPTLLLFAGDDWLVNAMGSRMFASSSPTDMVQAQAFEDFYHEIFNEVHRLEPVDALMQWLDNRF
jgi:alpha-beta hydrolase superfamily lysophospholipase